MSKPLVLALDTALNACSAAVWQNGKTLSRESREMARGQAEEIVPMMQRVLKHAGTGADTLDLIAVTTGPGAFTGVRIGLSAARALSMAVNVPALGVTTLCVLAEQAARTVDAEGVLVMALETKRADVYAQTFRMMKNGTPPEPLSDAVCATPEDLGALIGKHAGGGPVTLAGDGAPKVLAWKIGTFSVIEGLTHPDPGVVAACAARQWDGGPLPPPEPVYLRPAEARPAQPTRWDGGGDKT